MNRASHAAVFNRGLESHPLAATLAHVGAPTPAVLTRGLEKWEVGVRVSERKKELVIDRVKESVRARDR